MVMSDYSALDLALDGDDSNPFGAVSSSVDVQVEPSVKAGSVMTKSSAGVGLGSGGLFSGVHRSLRSEKSKIQSVDGSKASVTAGSQGQEEDDWVLPGQQTGRVSTKLKPWSESALGPGWVQPRDDELMEIFRQRSGEKEPAYKQRISKLRTISTAFRVVYRDDVLSGGSFVAYATKLKNNGGSHPDQSKQELVSYITKPLEIIAEEALSPNVMANLASGLATSLSELGFVRDQDYDRRVRIIKSSVVSKGPAQARMLSQTDIDTVDDQSLKFQLIMALNSGLRGKHLRHMSRSHLCFEAAIVALTKEQGERWERAGVVREEEGQFLETGTGSDKSGETKPVLTGRKGLQHERVEDTVTQRPNGSYLARVQCISLCIPNDKTVQMEGRQFKIACTQGPTCRSPNCLFHDPDMRNLTEKTRDLKHEALVIDRLDELLSQLNLSEHSLHVSLANSLDAAAKLADKLGKKEQEELDRGLRSAEESSAFVSGGAYPSTVGFYCRNRVQCLMGWSMGSSMVDHYCRLPRRPTWDACDVSLISINCREDSDCIKLKEPPGRTTFIPNLRYFNLHSTISPLENRLLQMKKHVSAMKSPQYLSVHSGELLTIIQMALRGLTADDGDVPKREEGADLELDDENPLGGAAKSGLGGALSDSLGEEDGMLPGLGARSSSPMVSPMLEYKAKAPVVMPRLAVAPVGRPRVPPPATSGLFSAVSLSGTSSGGRSGPVGRSQPVTKTPVPNSKGHVAVAGAAGARETGGGEKISLKAASRSSTFPDMRDSAQVRKRDLGAVLPDMQGSTFPSSHAKQNSGAGLPKPAQSGMSGSSAASSGKEPDRQPDTPEPVGLGGNDSSLKYAGRSDPFRHNTGSNTIPLGRSGSGVGGPTSPRRDRDTRRGNIPSKEVENDKRGAGGQERGGIGNKRFGGRSAGTLRFGGPSDLEGQGGRLSTGGEQASLDSWKSDSAKQGHGSSKWTAEGWNAWSDSKHKDGGGVGTKQSWSNEQWDKWGREQEGASASTSSSSGQNSGKAKMDMAAWQEQLDRDFKKTNKDPVREGQHGDGEQLVPVEFVSSALISDELLQLILRWRATEGSKLLQPIWERIAVETGSPPTPVPADAFIEGIACAAIISDFVHQEFEEVETTIESKSMVSLEIAAKIAASAKADDPLPEQLRPYRSGAQTFAGLYISDRKNGGAPLMSVKKDHMPRGMDDPGNSAYVEVWERIKEDLKNCPYAADDAGLPRFEVDAIKRGPGIIAMISSANSIGNAIEMLCALEWTRHVFVVRDGVDSTTPKFGPPRSRSTKYLTEIGASLQLFKSWY